MKNSLKSYIPVMSHEIIGWLFSVYPDQEEGAVVWIISDDGVRYRLSYPYPTSFYLAARDISRLQEVSKYLSGWRNPPEMQFKTKKDLFKGRLQVLEIQSRDPITQQNVFYNIQKRFKYLQFYNAKIPFSVRFGGETGSFPMAKCRLTVNEKTITGMEVLDSPWNISYDLPQMRELIIEPDSDPTYAEPKYITLKTGESTRRLKTSDDRSLLLGFVEIMDSY